MKRIFSLVLALLLVATSVPFAAKAERSAKLSMTNSVALQGQQIKMVVNLAENPNLATLSLKIQYDTDLLELLSVENNGLFPYGGENPELSSPTQITLVNPDPAAGTKTGAFISLLFQVKETASVGDTATVSVSCNEARDVNFFSVAVTGASATVTVVERADADLDGDAAVTSGDAIYLLYHTLFGSERYPVSGNCDYDKDGSITSGDAIYLLYHTLFGSERYPI